jgi:hypothetical protein
MRDFFEAACEAENPLERHADISDDLDFAIRNEVHHKDDLEDMRTQTFNQLQQWAGELEKHQHNLNAGRSANST